MTDTKKLSIVPIKKTNNEHRGNMIKGLEDQIRLLKECDDAFFCFSVVGYDKKQSAHSSTADGTLTFRAMIGAIEDEKMSLIDYIRDNPE